MVGRTGTEPIDDRAAELRRQAQSGPAISVDEFRRRSRRSFLTGAAGVRRCGGLWRWVQTQRTDDGIPNVLRNALETNEAIWSNLADGRSAPEYPISRATRSRSTG